MQSARRVQHPAATGENVQVRGVAPCSGQLFRSGHVGLEPACRGEGKLATAKV